MRAAVRFTVGSLLIATALCGLPDPSGAQESPADARPLFAGRNVLVVYLSRTNNTKAVAELIHQRVGGTIAAVEPATPYPSDYEATVQQVTRENDTGHLPPLKASVERIEQYDVVFLGFPTWGMQLPPPMKSFLRTHDLRGKTVVPFNTHAGYGVGRSLQTVRDLCAGCTVLEAFSTRGGVERDGRYLVIQGARATDVREELARWLQTIDATSVATARSRRRRPRTSH